MYQAPYPEPSWGSPQVAEYNGFGAPGAAANSYQQEDGSWSSPTGDVFAGHRDQNVHLAGGVGGTSGFGPGGPCAGAGGFGCEGGYPGAGHCGCNGFNEYGCAAAGGGPSHGNGGDGGYVAGGTGAGFGGFGGCVEEGFGGCGNRFGGKGINGEWNGGSGGYGYGGGKCGGYHYEDYPRYNQGSGPTYAQDNLGEIVFSGQGGPAETAKVTILGKQGEAVPSAMMTWELCDQVFPPIVMNQLRGAGFTGPTPVQATTWPVALQGRDLIGVAKTGSGKTLAYLLPGFIRIINGQVQGRGPHILVLAPTRELARQIEEEAEKFGAPCRIRAVCFYGGAPRGPQLGQLRRGAQVVVATPGRLNDFLESSQVNLSQAKYCVLDEADRMLDMGFEPQIRSILSRCPSPKQMLLYTATWAKEVRSLASEFLDTPFCMNVGHQELVANEDVQQHVVIVQSDEQKLEELRKVLENCLQGDLVLVFCDTKMGCAWLGEHLYSQYRIPCVALHGDLAQRDRDYAIEAFKSGRRPIMVGTDVASRGLDIKGIKAVINFDAASGSEEYVHRIGRTGRAGVKGFAYTFLTPKESKKARYIVSVMEAGGLEIPEELAALAGTGRGFGGRKGKGKGKGKGGKGKRTGGKGKGEGKGKRGGDKGGFGFSGPSQ